MISYFSAQPRESAVSELSEQLRGCAAKLRDRPSLWAITGGSSAVFWAETVMQVLASLPLAKICLTDTFLEAEAKTQGRLDTNEGRVLDAGVSEALAQQLISANQLIFPDFNYKTPESIAFDLNNRILQHRGGAFFDVVIGSSGGGLYRDDGPADPGHIFGIPHGVPEIYSSDEPYVVIEDMPKPPKRRITLTGRGIGALYLFCLGPQKANALANIQADLPLGQCPAGDVARFAEEAMVIHG